MANASIAPTTSLTHFVTAFEVDGPALVEVMTARQELSMPPSITLEQINGFTLYATRTILSGRGDELIDLASTNLTRRIF
jgi:pyruvate dehydrogenase (quinone)